MTRTAPYKCKSIYQGRVWRWTSFNIPSNKWKTAHLTVWLCSSQPAEPVKRVELPAGLQQWLGLSMTSMHIMTDGSSDGVIYISSSTCPRSVHIQLHTGVTQFDRNSTIYNINNPTYTPTKTWKSSVKAFLWNRGILMKRLEFCDSSAYHADY